MRGLSKEREGKGRRNNIGRTCDEKRIWESSQDGKHQTPNEAGTHHGEQQLTPRRQQLCSIQQAVAIDDQQRRIPSQAGGAGQDAKVLLAFPGLLAQQTPTPFAPLPPWPPTHHTILPHHHRLNDPNSLLTRHKPHSHRRYRYRHKQQRQRQIQPPSPASEIHSFSPTSPHPTQPTQ